MESRGESWLLPGRGLVAARENEPSDLSPRFRPFGTSLFRGGIPIQKESDEVNETLSPMRATLRSTRNVETSYGKEEAIETILEGQ